MSECFICVRNQSLRLGGKSSFRSKSSSNLIVSQKIKGLSKVDPNKIQQPALFSVKIKGAGNVKSRAKLSQNIIGLDSINNGKIKAKINASGNARVNISSSSKLTNVYTDKFAGNINQISNLKNFHCVQKLYPIRDIITSLNNSFFINKDRQTTDLYQSIDEGVFTGNYNENLNKSNLISDDDASYIQPSSVFTSGTFRYKCEVTRPYHHPTNSFLFLRASAPLSNYGADIPPEYRIHNIKLEDPSGNIIAKYKEFTLRGDADYSQPIKNYATYISEPEINNANLRTWENDYPVLSEPSGYTLSMDFDIICLDDPFDQGFNKGYEEKACEIKFVETGDNDYLAIDGAPLSTHTQGYHLNPTNTIRISSIEICNSGDLCGSCEISGIKRENYFNFYTNVDKIGQRLSRVIYPVEILTSDYNVDIYPESYSTWLSSEDFNEQVADNTTASGAQVLTSKINSLSNVDFITLLDTSPFSDSGRLTLRFSHQPPKSFVGLRGGAFDLSKSDAFDAAKVASITGVDNFFMVDSVELKIVAKKATGSRDYVLDVVGYSDDKILNVTPKIGAFLQNTEQGEGDVPLISGFNPVNDLAISAESISDKSQYYEDYLTSVDAGDHYKLSSLPIINSTSFQEYTIPLTIYEDFVSVGKSKDYSLSSYFENLYIDLYPIPSGASISSISMIVHYKPSNGIMLHTLGTPTNRELGIRDINLLPVGRAKNTDTLLNTDYIDSPLSVVSGIPQAYGEPQTLKTNYARRWRGVDGNIVNGPYNPEEFDFSFNNPEADYPFLDGYFDLTNTQNNFVLTNNHPYNHALSGYYNGSEQIIKNIGLRFGSSSLFPYPTPYTTIDWTKDGDPLYGKICDAYDSAIRLSGDLGNISFGDAPISSGFAVYFRFTPDYNMSGVNYNLYNSGVLWSKWSENKDLEVALGFENGHIALFVNNDDELLKIVDSALYSDYQYPLSTIVTYDDFGTVRLYCNNELNNESYQKGYVENVSLKLGDSDLVFGYSAGSGIGSNIFAHEIGISSSGNIVNNSPRRLYKQTTADSFLDGHSHFFSSVVPTNKFKLHEYVDENISSWRLGDFKTCSFSPDFDGFTKRIGQDYIIHSLKSGGTSYGIEVSGINTSGLMYHTQIENDFLRFNLQDIPDVNSAFYSVKPRISKNIPRGYKFNEKALVVETIIEHETNNNILWSDGAVGPKLIVSLYSKNQDPIDRPSKVNWGLINRSIHYLPPSGCYEKISSTFNYNDLLDISEPWALFDLDNLRSEFDHKYYSKDIDDMFLQYDLVYPAVSGLESKIKIHSANVRLEDALVYWTQDNSQFGLYASGESISYGSLNILTYGSAEHEQEFPLFINGSPWPESSGSLNLSIQGVVGVPNSNVNLFLQNSGIVSQLGPDLFVSGGFPRAEQSFNLVMIDNTLDQIRTNSFSLFSNTSGPGLAENIIPLTLADSFITRDFFRNEAFNLVLYNEQIIVRNSENSVNFFINTDIDYIDLSGTFNLFLLNYPPRQANVSRQAIVSWNVQDLGSAIDPIIDSSIPFLDASDEIRGVELSCFGECGSSTACKEQPIKVHNINWYSDEPCLDGGVFRAKNTYTNLQTSGFKTEIGYSGHFYGIRKYDGLIPNAPYNIVLTNRSGSDEIIDLPTRFVELDYGSNEYVNYSGVKLAADKGLDESERQEGNKYGKSVVVKEDLIAVGAPFQELSYDEYDSSGNTITSTLEEAGAVFLYRRDPRPIGSTWPEDQHKSNWKLETKLTLPSGLLKDYPTIVPRNSLGGVSLPSPIFERFWNVGQEGRQFGHSLSLGVNKNVKSFQEDKKEVLVVGGPSAKWSRDFEDLNISGVSVGLIVFTDEFEPSKPDPSDPNKTRGFSSIVRSIQNKDLLFTYFCDPPVKFDVKIIICEPISAFTNKELLDFPEPKPTFITKKRIPRNQGIPTIQDELAVFSGIKSAFDEAFPYDTNKIHNNIPALLGIVVDGTRSLGRNSIEPGLSRFLSYYGEYSFASGLRDFNNVQSSGGLYYFGEGQELQFIEEDWIDMSIRSLDQLLDTGRLVRENQVRFFASNIGPQFFNENLQEFNYPPTSGGSVYVFEKESGNWNLIQEIKSPVISYDAIDRFGHAVAISEDTNIIAVGSPYISECCKIYQYNESEKQRLFNGLYSWLVHENSLTLGSQQRYVNLIDQYTAWLEQYGFNYANETLYANLTATEKFKARDYLEIEEYENIYTYNYKNIPYVGTWEFIPEVFAPSSRLGYSASVNEDGSIVAFGAPTDSFNIFDDRNVYYKNDGYLDPLNVDLINGTITPSWRSNVNSGAVRLFESREFYPHLSVVEFGKFGNLQQSLGDPLDSGHFDYLSSIFSDKNFRKLSEDEVSIPKDAGLAFIITPGEDALSDEVLNNIVRWLSLGDRNLVLVGNDPVWENSGVYGISNDIINKILSGLNSKMRIYPARNEYESLPSGKSLAIPSYRPKFGTQTYIQAFNIETAYGVGDIRMHLPGYFRQSPCSDISLNTKCELPLSHRGDLRAEWLESCVRSDCGATTIQYPVNWPFVFKTFSPDCCSFELETINVGRFDLENQDPIPLLVAAENSTFNRTVPAVPASFIYEPIIEQKTLTTTQTIFEFDDDALFQTPSFVWNSNSQDYSSYERNINNSLSPWFEPARFQNRKGLLQASANSLEETFTGSRKLFDIAPFCVEQKFGSSSVFAIAGVETESQASLLSSFSGRADNNINFYANLVSKTFRGESNIAQIGGWTQRTSFVNAYSKSILYELFLNIGNEVDLGVTNLSPVYDVCWIANPKGLPSQQELSDLKNWLNFGNKKLIITHDSSIDQMLLTTQLLSLLETDIRPMYLPFREEYVNLSGGVLTINPNHPISNGFDVFPTANFIVNSSFVAFETNDKIIPICFNNSPVYDDELITRGFLRLDSGIDKVVFPAVPGSGYKIFIDTVSETLFENLPIDIYIKNASIRPGLPSPDTSLNFNAAIDDFSIPNVGVFRQISNATINKIETTAFNLQVETGKNEIEFYINSYRPRIDEKNYVPKTIRLVGISGILVPISSAVRGTNFTYQDVVGYNKIQISESTPETIVIETATRPISTLNDKYCDGDCIEAGFGNKFIADGPVLVAQEIESVSSFNAGVARSRITVISDSSLVQGRYMSDEFGRLSSGTVGFIRSLYPETNFPLQNSGKQYDTLTKIVGPERGSPQKYLALKGNEISVERFENGGSRPSISAFSDKESRYDPRFVLRPDPPWSDTDAEEIKEFFKNEEISNFYNQTLNFGATPKFSGIINSKSYVDVGIEGGIPEIMKDTGKDYLDFDEFPSGYPGDLFGYSISLSDNRLIVGSPFSAFSDENINDWLYYLLNQGASGIILSSNGGAGSVYIYEKTFKGSGVRNTITPWEFMQKLRPQQINVGTTTDQFGYSVSINSDIIIVGAPGHDFGKYIENIYDTGPFIRKAFNEEFDIPDRLIVDLGDQDSRDIFGSGEVISNNGAIFTFENNVREWVSRTTGWSFIEKIIPDSGNRIQNDLFGRSVNVHRSFRTDSDYVIVGGAENHPYSSSGVNLLDRAGAAYTNDIMLRQPPPVFPNPNAYVDAKVFGERGQGGDPTLRLITDNSIGNRPFSNSGIIYTNERGAIFLEVSGQDPSVRGFIKHRPYVVSVEGRYFEGQNQNDNITLFIDGNIEKEQNMNLFVGATTGNVYNTLGLSISSIVDFGLDSLNIYTDCPEPTEVLNSGLNLFTASGVGLGTNNLNMRIRGY
jgi:hypothetical protein